MPHPESRTIAATTHGRYVLRAGAPGVPIVVGFHGYAESADTQMARLTDVPRIARWTLVCVQGLHRFYQRRSDEVVASWMTRQDRELAIADNVAYVATVIDHLCRESGSRPPIAFAGFSQGVAMAFRAACLGPYAPSAIVALGGDVPPELGPEALARAPRVLLARGRDDRWYTDPMLANDVARLGAAGVPVQAVVVDGGHEWTAAFADAVGMFLEALE